MYKKIVFTVSFMLFSLYGSAQNNINDYKYIIIPKKYDFAKSEDQYQLNSLTKFLFNKHGYEAYFENEEFPEDLEKNRCLALTTEVSNEKKNMFKTKLEIILKDCYGKVVITSEIGESRLKKFNKSYTQALRAAFETFENLEYKYVPKQEISIETPKTETINIEESKAKDVSEDVVKVVKEEVNNEVDKVAEVVREAESNTKDNSDLYYAQPTKNGFQLVDSEPKIVMILLSTAAEDVYLVKDKNAIVFKEDGFWYYSENNGKGAEKKLINIKF